MEEWQRLELVIKKENIDKIKNKKILVIGLGGVGSYVVESLVRCGIENITIVDNDIIDITNINRQLLALHSTIKRKKVDVCEERILDINPNCRVTKIDTFITKDNIDLLFKTKIDYIIDACDFMETKKELIKYSIKNKINLISSMGTGNKLDPTKLEIVDLRKTAYDPIAKILRRMLKEEKIKEKVMVVCSSEIPLKTESKIIGSVSFVTSVAGLLCTSYVINHIIGENND
ncbi:MAG: tRNA threonylcarbamoyladenosine dehydratase [Bacilli bacterium]|nr:tRNA threonylcarbamoyladenosine dehydratase [Bacilli bacterium]